MFKHSITKLTAGKLPLKMDSIKLSAATTVKRSRLIAYGAIFTALYMLLSYSSAISIGPILRGSDAHLFRALLMVIIAARLGVPGGPIVMSIVSGVLLLAVPAPVAFLYLPGTIAAGLVYDLSLRGGNYSHNARNGVRVFIGSLGSGVSESIVVTGGFFVIGFSFTEIVTALAASGYASAGILGIWVFAIGKNLLMSGIGAGLAMIMIKLISRRNR